MAITVSLQQPSTKQVTAVTGGTTGPAGSAGASIEVQGPWATSTSYSYRDLVYHNGNSYVATSSHTSAAATEPGTGASWATKWTLALAAPINDAGTGSTTELWSIDKLEDELALKANASHTHAASDITSGMLDDANISESSVTQHEAAIDHDALTNYSADEHRTINDAGTANTDLWSANKLTSELTAKADANHTHAATDITSGPLAAANIPEAGVTQHVGALDHGSMTGLGDNDHTAHPTNIVDDSLFGSSPDSGGIPDQNFIEGDTDIKGLLGLRRSSTADAGKPAATELELFALYDGSVRAFGWADLNQYASHALLASTVQEYFDLNADVFIIDADIYIDDGADIRFYEETANGTYYIGLRAPSDLTALYEYVLPTKATQDAHNLHHVTDGSENGKLYWEESSGSAFPTTYLYHGRRFFRTDLGEWFTYYNGEDWGSPAVPAWVGDQVLVYGFGRNTSSTAGTVSLMAVGNAGVTTSDTGYRLPYNCFLTGGTIQNGNSVLSIGGSFAVKLNSSGAWSLSFSGGATRSSNTSNWVEADSGDILWAECTQSSGTITDPIGTVFARRRITA